MAKNNLEIADGNVLETSVPDEVVTVSGGSRPSTNLKLGTYYTDQVPLKPSYVSRGEQMAESQFNQNVTQARGSALQGAEELVKTGGEMQTQLALGDYMRAQSAEKAGWTGGYMLDQARQGEYLKATIQAQMYSAQDLQKYGLESQLEAARMAYDLGKEQLAQQYYNEAYQRALTEANLFGYYVAPETRDMFNQYQAAITAKNANPDDPDAQRIIDTVEQFYGKEGLTEADIRAFSQTTLEMQQIMSAKFDAAMATIESDPSKFLVKDESGNYAFDANGNYITLDMDDINKADLMNFLTSDNNSQTKTSDAAIRSYLRYLGQSTINGYFSSLGENETANNQGFVDWLNQNPNQLLEWINNTFGEDTENKNKFLKEIGDELSINLSGSKGSITATFNIKENKVELGTLSSGGDGNDGGSNSPSWTPGVSSAESVVNYFKIPFNNTSINWNQLSSLYSDFGDKANTTLSKDQIASFFASDINQFNNLATSPLHSGSSEPSYDTKKNLWDFMNRMHLLSGGSNPQETALKIFEKRFGLPAGSASYEMFNLNNTSGDYFGIKLSTGNMSTQQINDLKAKGFKEQGGKLVLSASPVSTRDKWGFGNDAGANADYQTGTGWNTGKYGDLKMIGLFMLWLDTE